MRSLLTFPLLKVRRSDPLNEILIYGDIGFEVQAKDVVNQLNDADGPVTVRVDSFGGDVYAGISILNALRRYPDVVTVYVDGIAASAASFIAVGGACLLYTSPSSRDRQKSRMPSSA